MSRAVFERKALDDLNEVDPGLAATILAEFRPLSAKLIGWIEQALQTSDFKALEMHAHALRAKAKPLGFEQLADLCREIETDAVKQVARAELVSRLTAARDAAVAEISKAV